MDIIEEYALNEKLIEIRKDRNLRIRACFENMINIKYLYLDDLKGITTNKEFEKFKRNFCAKLNPKLGNIYSDLELYTMPIFEVAKESIKLNPKKKIKK